MTLSPKYILNQRGFTMTELIVVMVIIGILAAVAIPRFFDRDTFDSRGFYDQTISTLRYAQKTAIAQHSFVCASFTLNSVTLMLGSTATTCVTNLIGPTGSSPYKTLSNKASFTAAQAAFSFDALGKPYDAAGVAFAANRTISVSNYATSITVEKETGYVY